MWIWIFIGCVKSIQVESFESTWQTIDESFPYEDFQGVNWVAVHDEYLPKAKKAKSNEELRPILTEMIEELEVSHIGIIPSEAYDRAKKDDSKTTQSNNSDKEQKSDIIPQGWVGLDARWIDNSLLVTKVSDFAQEQGVELGWTILAIDGIDTSAVLPKISDSEPREQEFEMGRLAIGHFEGNTSETLEISFKDFEGNVIEKEMPFHPEGTITTPEFGNLPICGIRVSHHPLQEGPYYLSFNMFLMPIKPLITEAFETVVAQNSPGMIIDLRGNPGGLIDLGVFLASHFVSEPDLDLGEQISRDGNLFLTIYPRPTAQRYTGPVAILIDELSASTSEVLAGGLQELGQVKVFGTQSAGKALPSVIKDLPNGDRLQYVIFDLKTPIGGRYEGDGVAPDFVVAHTKEALQNGEDLALQSAIQWIHSQNTPLSPPATP